MSNSPVQETRGAYADTDAFVGLVFAISGKFSEPHTALSALIKRHAGDVKASVTKAVTHLVSTVDDFGARSHKVDKALANGIPIVTERWVRESIEANEALPLRPEYVLHAGNQPLAESEEATAVKSSPRTASVDEGAKGEQGQENEAGDARELQEQSAEEAGPPPTAPSISIDESKLPSAILTQAKDASLPVLHATIGDMHPAAPSPPPAPSLSAATSTIVPPPVAELPTAVQPPRPTEQQTAAPAAPVDAPLSPVSVAEGAESMVDVNAPAAPSALTPTEETLLIEHTAAARIPPLPSPSREALQEAAAAEGDTMVTDDADAGREEEAHVGEKRKVEEPPAPIVEPEAPPTKRRKLENEEQQAEVAGAAPSQNGGQPEGESAQPAPTTEALERAPPAESNAGSSAVLPPSQALSLPVAPPPAMDVTPSGAETGGPTAMDVTQRAYHLKVLQRKEYSAGTAHELAGLVEKQLLEGINVHNDSTVGLGSLADVFARGVDGGAVLIENVRDYTGEDYYNIITYARLGREFGSLHRNDEILAVGLVRDGTFSAVRAEDQPLMERLLHVHQPIVPISASSPATS